MIWLLLYMCGWIICFDTTTRTDTYAKTDPKDRRWLRIAVACAWPLVLVVVVATVVAMAVKAIVKGPPS